MKNHVQNLAKCLFGLILLSTPEIVQSQNLNIVNTTDGGNLIGLYNVRTGVFSGLGMTGSSSDYNSYNTFYGYASAFGANSNVNGENIKNTIVGNLAGYGLTTGSYVTVLGATTVYKNAILLTLFFGFVSLIFIGISKAQLKKSTRTKSIATQIKLWPTMPKIPLLARMSRQTVRRCHRDLERSIDN